MTVLFHLSFSFLHHPTDRLLLSHFRQRTYLTDQKENLDSRPAVTRSLSIDNNLMIVIPDRAVISLVMARLGRRGVFLFRSVVAIRGSLGSIFIQEAQKIRYFILALGTYRQPWLSSRSFAHEFARRGNEGSRWRSGSARRTDPVYAKKRGSGEKKRKGEEERQMEGKGEKKRRNATFSDTRTCKVCAHTGTRQRTGTYVQN